MTSNNLVNKDNMNPMPFLTQKEQKRIEWMLVLILMLAFVITSISQTNLNDINYQAQSEFQPTIKDAVKFSDIPEIKDSVKRIENIKYTIASRPLFTKYEIKTIEAAKLKNEPLTKLYHSLLKLGYGPIYSMPLGEFWIANARAKETSFGAHLKHFSSKTHLKDVGKGDFSDNIATVYGKRFYKKHTLSGEMNYVRNVTHYYGYPDTLLTKDQQNNTRQRYQLFEPKVQLRSHYTDSTHINHNIQLGYYNLQSLYKETENNVKVNALGELFVNKEKLNIAVLADFYNHKQANDTINDLIVSINPSFEASGKKWHADIGVNATLDNFGNTSRFYFYPQINMYYDIYENLIIPYVGATGSLIKNSMRSLTSDNPFVDTTINYQNTNNKFNLFGGLRGNLSSSTSYDASLKYSQYGNLYFYVIDYSSSNQLYNQFNVIYDDASVLTITGQLKQQVKEKITIIAKGDYYIYNTKNLTRAYSKPDFNLTGSAIYNLKSKIILRADLFFMGKQWAYSQGYDNGAPVLKPKQINGWADINLEAEYRYSKMLSFFARVNNIANQRYYRWERYPSQRFNFMLGLTFVPF